MVSNVLHYTSFSYKATEKINPISYYDNRASCKERLGVFDDGDMMIIKITPSPALLPANQMPGLKILVN